jgi:dimethylargininase
MTFRGAIVRPPADTFADGLTTAALGAPDLALARTQHDGYCAALEACGLALTRLAPDARHPDSTFVEDTAVLLGGRAIVTRPGAPSRAGEVAEIRTVLAALGFELAEIAAPGTLDGGDVCERGRRLLVGLSERTNADGARQLAAIAAAHGISCETVDIRGIPGLLHLKSGLTALEDGTFLAIAALARHPALGGGRVVEVSPAEEHAANAIEVNGRVLVPQGAPALVSTLRAEGRDVLELPMSEFRKMDGGLSCLSLRY